MLGMVQLVKMLKNDIGIDGSSKIYYNNLPLNKKVLFHEKDNQIG